MSIYCSIRPEYRLFSVKISNITKTCDCTIITCFSYIYIYFFFKIWLIGTGNKLNHVKVESDHKSKIWCKSIGVTTVVVIIIPVYIRPRGQWAKFLPLLFIYCLLFPFSQLQGHPFPCYNSSLGAASIRFIIYNDYGQPTWFHLTEITLTISNSKFLRRNAILIRRLFSASR